MNKARRSSGNAVPTNSAGRPEARKSAAMTSAQPGQEQRMELVERIKQLKAERKRYFDVEGDGVDVLLTDVWNFLEARPTADLGEDGELAAAIYEALKADGGDAYMDDGEYLDGVTLDGSFDLLAAAKKLRAVLSRSEK